MAPRAKPPRAWKVDDLLDLGEKEGVSYLKAIPILILEGWVRGEREENVANYAWTKDIARRLVSSKLVPPFKPKGTSNILGALGAIQTSRKLIRPRLLEYQGSGMSWVNLPHYEALLQEYRKEYCRRYPEDYRKLFIHGEPEWELINLQQNETKEWVSSPVAKVTDDIRSLVAPIEQLLRDRQQAIEKLQSQNQRLQEEILSQQATLKERRVHAYRSILDEELRTDCATLLESSDTYIDAIRRAGVVLEERLRQTVGGNDQVRSKEGVELVDFALVPKTGRLVISDHPAEQDGVRMLFRGAVQFIRNPPAHKKIQYSEREAWQTIGLMDYLLLLLGQAKRRE